MEPNDNKSKDPPSLSNTDRNFSASNREKLTNEHFRDLLNLTDADYAAAPDLTDKQLLEFDVGIPANNMEGFSDHSNVDFSNVPVQTEEELRELGVANINKQLTELGNELLGSPAIGSQVAEKSLSSPTVQHTAGGSGAGKAIVQSEEADEGEVTEEELQMDDAELDDERFGPTSDESPSHGATNTIHPEILSGLGPTREVSVEGKVGSNANAELLAGEDVVALGGEAEEEVQHGDEEYEWENDYGEVDALIQQPLWSNIISNPMEASSWLASHPFLRKANPENDDVKECGDLIPIANRIFNAIHGPARVAAPTWTANQQTFFTDYQVKGKAAVDKALSTTHGCKRGQSNVILAVSQVWGMHNGGISATNENQTFDGTLKFSERIDHIILAVGIKRTGHSLIRGNVEATSQLLQDPRAVLQARQNNAKQNRRKKGLMDAAALALAQAAGAAAAQAPAITPAVPLTATAPAPAVRKARKGKESLAMDPVATPSGLTLPGAQSMTNTGFSASGPPSRPSTSLSGMPWESLAGRMNGRDIAPKRLHESMEDFQSTSTKPTKRLKGTSPEIPYIPIDPTYQAPNLFHHQGTGINVPPEAPNNHTSRSIHNGTSFGQATPSLGLSTDVENTGHYGTAGLAPDPPDLTSTQMNEIIRAAGPPGRSSRRTEQEMLALDTDTDENYDDNTENGFGAGNRPYSSGEGC